MRLLALALMIGCGRIGFDADADAALDAVEVETIEIDWMFAIDARIDASLSTMPLGSEVQLELGSGRRVLVRFDLSPLAGRRVAAGRLRLWDYGSGDTTGNLAYAYRVLESWDEATVTWNERTAGIAWAQAGVNGAARDPTAIGSIAMSAWTPDNSADVELAPDILRDWVADPSTNFGVLLAGGSSEHVHLYSCESSVVDARPRLILDVER